MKSAPPLSGRSDDAGASKKEEIKRHAIAVLFTAVVHLLIFVVIIFFQEKNTDGEPEPTIGSVYIVLEEEKPAEEIPSPLEEAPPVPEIEFPGKEVRAPEPGQVETAVTIDDAPKDVAAEPHGPEVQPDISDEDIALEQSPKVESREEIEKDNETNTSAHVPNDSFAYTDSSAPPDSSSSKPSSASIPAEPPPYTPPKPLSPPNAAYPPSSRRKGEEGTVRILIYVNENGKAAKIEIETSSGYPVLDKAALEAAKTVRFTPATSGGRPQSSEIVLPIRFSLSQ